MKKAWNPLRLFPPLLPSISFEALNENSKGDTKWDQFIRDSCQDLMKEKEKEDRERTELKEIEAKGQEEEKERQEEKEKHEREVKAQEEKIQTQEEDRVWTEEQKKNWDSSSNETNQNKSDSNKEEETNLTAWNKKYRTFKKGQIILIHNDLIDYYLDDYQFVEISDVDDYTFKVKIPTASNSNGFHEKDIWIELDEDSYSTDVFTKHITDRVGSKNCFDLIVQTFQTARKKIIFQKQKCRYGKKCNDIRPGHMMNYFH